MPLAIADRFQAGEILTADDKGILSKLIISSNNTEELTLAIQTYFEAFPCEGFIIDRVRHLLGNCPRPNLAAACLRAVVEHCGEGIQQSLDYTRGFVDFSKFEYWTDEVIYSSNYFRRNFTVLSPFDKKRLTNLVEEASQAGAIELVELLV